MVFLGIRLSSRPVLTPGKMTLAVCSYLDPENRGLKRAIDGLIWA